MHIGAGDVLPIPVRAGRAGGTAGGPGGYRVAPVPDTGERVDRQRGAGG
ncbi:MAG: hypothetical protein IMZ58_08440 [Thermoplasmata archaeon]|nr:hypothetical protein [Thermoplasmata archaeon]